jgi:hypothetical protein
MLLYRTPESLQEKFHNQLQNPEGLFQVESWLLHHGEKLQNRFQLSAYKLMNHLLKTTDIFNFWRSPSSGLDYLICRSHRVYRIGRAPYCQAFDRFRKSFPRTNTGITLGGRALFKCRYPGPQPLNGFGFAPKPNQRAHRRTYPVVRASAD